MRTSAEWQAQVQRTGYHSVQFNYKSTGTAACFFSRCSMPCSLNGSALAGAEEPAREQGIVVLPREERFTATMVLIWSGRPVR